MADSISRQAAIDAICQDWCGTSNADCKTPFNPSTDDYYHCDGCGDVQLIKALPSADVQPVQRWIPCSERLPSEEGEYLVTLISYGYGSKYQVIDIAGFENGEWFKWENYEWFQCCDVIAWMPLPEPYKDGEQND